MPYIMMISQIKVFCGFLYNWYAVNDSLGFCPEGWMVPTKDDWIILVSNFGNDGVACSKLKINGFDDMINPNSKATNESGFSALPAGFRNGTSCAYEKIRENAYFWSATGNSGNTAFFRGLDYNSVTVSGDGSAIKSNAYSVRCLKIPLIFKTEVNVIKAYFVFQQ